MKAVIYNKKAKPHRLTLTEVEKPVPGDDEVLIKIIAGSVNAADYRSLQLHIIPKRKIFGADIAGKVETCGKNVRQFKPGDEVMGDLASFDFGGFAEYTIAPEKALVRKPAKISFETAAALPLAGLTALQALRDKGKIQKGHQVLIAGSAGGVGTYAVQLAKYFGAEVTAVCSSRNVEQSRALGADRVIDYTREDFAGESKTYDIILAVNGNRSLSVYKRCLNPGGIYVMVGGSYRQIIRSLLFGRLMSSGSKKMTTCTAKADQKDLEFIAKLAEEGQISPVIERRYTLEQAPEAMSYLAKGHASGKVVINVE